MSLKVEIENFVKADLANVDPSHDWLHILRVRVNAMKILKAEQEAGRLLEACPFIVELAALLHDVGDCKYSGSYEAGPIKIRQFLNLYVEKGEITSEQVEKIVFIVENVSYSKEAAKGFPAEEIPAELCIVQDADRLDAIGAIGAARCIAFGATRNRAFYSLGEETSETAHGHFFAKLFKLKSIMKTESGRLEAEHRHEFMKVFIHQLEEEAGLPHRDSAVSLL